MAEKGYHRSPMKWPGGKFDILNEVLGHLPQGERLIEPFAGSGVVTLNAPHRRAWLNDGNPYLITLYREIKRDPAGFIKVASKLFTVKGNTKEVYYRRRAELNAGAEGLRAAALFYYTLKAGFNGLVRFNSQGGFNVPFGQYAKLSFSEEAIYRLARRLKKARITNWDFERVIDAAGPGDVIYADPPYAPKNETAKFTTYLSGGFGPEDQLRLAEAARRATKRCVTVVVSNRDTAEVRDLYRGAAITSLQVRRHISCTAEGRGYDAEVIAVFQPVRRRGRSPTPLYTASL